MVKHKPNCPNASIDPRSAYMELSCDCGVVTAKMVNDQMRENMKDIEIQANIDRLEEIKKIAEDAIPKPTPLQVLTLAILDNQLAYQWSVQGFGVLRLYIRDVGRLHIWDSALRYPGVSMIHNHSWDLRSTIIFGCLVNTRYTTIPPEGYVPWPRPERYEGKRLITGYQTRDVVKLEPVTLYPDVVETFRSGDEYAQKAHEIHRTDAFDGTVTLMLRKEDENGQADVYWPAGTEWGTAKPRPATLEEIKSTVERALASIT